MAPSAHKRGPWGPQEDQALLHCVAHGGAQNWVRISTLVGTRSPKQCRERFHQNLKPVLNHAPITAEEGAIIEKSVGQIGKRWAEIARHLPGRSDNAVKNWFNGGVNRRKRMDVRRESAGRPAAHETAHRRQQLSLRRTTPLPLQSQQRLPTFSGQQLAEALIISPTRSDISTADSAGETPSLVSDNGSQRTVTSPSEHSHQQRYPCAPPHYPQSSWKSAYDEAQNSNAQAAFAQHDYRGSDDKPNNEMFNTSASPNRLLELSLAASCQPPTQSRIADPSLVAFQGLPPISELGVNSTLQSSAGSSSTSKYLYPSIDSTTKSSVESRMLGRTLGTPSKSRPPPPRLFSVQEQTLSSITPGDETSATKFGSAKIDVTSLLCHSQDDRQA